MVLRGLVAALVIAGAPARAMADRYEASLAGELRGGMARLGERGTTAEVVPAFGAAGRLTHAWSNTLAWDLHLDATLTQPATFPDAEAVIDGRTVRGPVTRRTVTAAAQVGAELRLGPRLIPTVRVALGPQLRYRSASDIGVVADGVPANVTIDALASFGFGFDFRLNSHRVIGVAIQVDHAQPLGDAASHDVIALTVRLASYWYPRWWSPTW